MNQHYFKFYLSILLIALLPSSSLLAQDQVQATWEERAMERFKPLTVENKKEITLAQPKDSGLRKDKLKPKRILVFYRCEAFVHTSIPWASTIRSFSSTSYSTPLSFIIAFPLIINQHLPVIAQFLQ